MKLSELSLPQRLAAGCGCVVGLALTVGAVLYLAFDVMSRRRLAEEMAGAPAGWADTLRSGGRLPDLAGLSLERDQPGDGSAVAHDTTLRWQQGNVEGPYRAIVAAGGTRDDSAAWRGVAADTALDRFVAASRQREWHALDRVLAGADTMVRRNILMLPAPRYAPLRNAVRGLVIRGLVRQQRGDVAGARRDLGAAMSLGEQLFRREPSAIGSFMGKSAIASAAHGWSRFGDVAHDTALAGRARTVLAWAAAAPSRMAQMLIVAPDTGLVLARDTTLVLGVRAEALANVMSAWLLRPRGFLFGPPRAHLRAMEELSHDRDPDFARLAAMTAATARRINVFGFSELLREAQLARR